jgi:DNA (cytosine-5)-methyltransferase 1
MAGGSIVRPKLLDLFCCQGGASMGYASAGFAVTGVDIAPQPRYLFPFAQGDAIAYLRRHAGAYDTFHASPPCQAFSNAQKIMGNEHPDLLTPVRELLLEIGKPFVIENVPGSPLRDPIELCGAMFGVETYRHRLFESNVPLAAPTHPQHVARTTKMGRRVRPGEYMHIVGNFSGVDRAREVMGMPWANRDGLREAIPPAYTEHIGGQLLAHINERAAA